MTESNQQSIWRRLCAVPEERPLLEAFLIDRESKEARTAYANWLSHYDPTRSTYFQSWVKDQVSLETTRQHCQDSREVMREVAADIDPLWIACVNVHQGMTGRVSRTTDEAIYVDLDGIEGEVHIRDMSW